MPRKKKYKEKVRMDFAIEGDLVKWFEYYCKSVKKTTKTEVLTDFLNNLKENHYESMVDMYKKKK